MGNAALPAKQSLAVTVLGLGEAGAAIGSDLAGRGLTVRGWDPLPGLSVPGVEIASGAAAAVKGSDVVLSINSAAAALVVAREVRPALGPGALFADLNTAAPAVKRQVADQLPGVPFADVALVAPVPGKGLATPALVSGSGADRFAEQFGELGMPVTVIGYEAGAAAARKLVRSVFAKGAAAAAGEALEAAEQLGCADWLWADLADTLAGADGNLLERWIEGSRVHAVRRSEEMHAAAEMLSEVGVEPWMASAAENRLRALAAGVAR